MLGCKFNSVIYAASRPIELIDTCWDVNLKLSYLDITSAKELIDTCWDVNVFSESVETFNA